MNFPPQPIDADLEGRITRGIAAIQREVGFSAHLNYREPGGSEAERAIAAAWLRSRIGRASGDRLLICPGTQTAVFDFLTALTSPGDVVLTEALTFPGINAAAACANVRLVGVPLDKDGIIPDALDAAYRRYTPKAAYLIPTIYNPTTATMPLSRRKEVANILRRNELLLVNAEAFSVDEGQPNAVRISLGAASSRAELVRALEILSTAPKTSAARTSIVNPTGPVVPWVPACLELKTSRDASRPAQASTGRPRSEVRISSDRPRVRLSP
jgi:DNA-binding transcriptional MocR family regulator